LNSIILLVIPLIFRKSITVFPIEEDLDLPPRLCKQWFFSR
jgi:hypothetical protein